MKSELNILLFKDCGVWIAQCLERDIAAQGETIKQALDEFGKMLAAEIAYALHKGVEPLSNLDQAPSFYWKQFDEGLFVNPQRPVFSIPVQTPPAFMIPELRELRVA